MNTLLIITISILIWPVGFYLILKILPKSGKMGINLEEVICPVCNTPLPKIRKPRNLNQVLWGGWSCDNCNCEIDKYGNRKNT